MTKLLEEAIDQLRKLPTSVQDSAARAMLFQLEEELEPGDREATAAGRNGFEKSNLITLDELQHERPYDCLP
jgi:hypothetical protein